MDPQISLFSNFFIKNGSHNTIYTFKNYFAIVISVISFQFQQNKSYPNRPYMDENENRKNIEGLESMISPSTLLLEREEVQFELQLIGRGLGKLHTY